MARPGTRRLGAAALAAICAVAAWGHARGGDRDGPVGAEPVALAELPPAPAIAAAFPADGRRRLVVRYADAAPAGDATAAARWVRVQAPGQHQVDLSVLGAYTGAVTTLVRDRTGAVWAGLVPGTALRPGDVGTDTLPGRTARAAGGVPAALAALPATEVRAVRDDLYALETAATDAELAAVPGLEVVQPDAPMTPLGASVPTGPSNDPTLVKQWDFANDGATTAGAVAGADARVLDGWPLGRGRGAVVAVIDSGFELDHEDMAGRWWLRPGCAGTVRECAGWNVVDDNAEVQDGGYRAADVNQHGTAVASRVTAATGNGIGIAGIAPGATVMPLRVSRDGTTASTSTFVAAIDWAVAHGADVINISWATPVNDPLLRDAIVRAGAAGVLVVAAAGNWGRDLARSPLYPAAWELENLVTVGATTNADTLWGTVGYGSMWGKAVDLFAGGQRAVVLSPADGVSLATGTSFAAPAVAGAAASLWALAPDLTAAEVADRLRSTARPVSGLAGRGRAGVLDLAALLATAAAPRVEFSGLDGLRAGRPGAIGIAAPAVPVAGRTWRLGLGVATAVGPRAVVGAAFGEGTDATGTVRVPAAEQVTLPVSLPAGLYALAAELVEPDGTVVLTQSAFFEVLTADGARPGLVVADETGPAAAVPDAPADTPATTTAGTSPSTTAGPVPSGTGATAPPPVTGTTAPSASGPGGPTPAPDTPVVPAPSAPVVPGDADGAAPGAPGASAAPVIGTPETTMPAERAIPVPEAPVIGTPETTMPAERAIPVPEAPGGDPVEYGLPGVPHGVRAQVRPAGMTLHWQAAEAGASPLGFRVYLDGTLAAQARAERIELDGLRAGARYSVRVSAHNTAGESAPSAALEVTIPAATTADAPTSEAPAAWTLSPTAGPAGQLVRIHTDDCDAGAAAVHFGAAAAEIRSVGVDAGVCRVSVTAPPGPDGQAVPVTVTDGDGRRFVLRQTFTYLGAGGGAGATGAAPAPGSGPAPGPTASGSAGDHPAPESGGGGTGPDAPTGESGGGGTGPDAPASTRPDPSPATDVPGAPAGGGTDTSEDPARAGTVVVTTTRFAPTSPLATIPVGMWTAHLCRQPRCGGVTI